MNKTAKVVRIGNRHGVRLPREFHFKGHEVRIRKVGDTIVLQPIIKNIQQWLAGIDPRAEEDASEGSCRNQPKGED